jgi:hypothetical protein
MHGGERGAGLDVDLPIVVHGFNMEPKFYVAGSKTPGITGTPLAWRVSTDMPNDLFDNFVSLYRIDQGFSPTLGFVRRTGIWETTGHIDYTPRPQRFGIRQLDLKAPIPSWDIISEVSGDLTDPSTWQTAEMEWRLFGADFQSGDRVEVNVQRQLDAPNAPFEIFEGKVVDAGRYWWTQGEVGYEMSAGRALSMDFTGQFGRLYNGHSRSAEVSATYRGGGNMIAGAGYEITAAHLPAGSFTAMQTNTRVEYAASTRASFLGFAQFGNEDHRIDFNLRFHWIPTIGDDLFIVWNSGFTTDPEAPWRFPARRAIARPLNGAFIVKAVHRLAP